VILRDAHSEDRAAIAHVHRSAFPGDGESRLVEALNDDGDVVASRIAVVDDAIVGHVLFSRMTVEAGGRTFNAAALAPVAVLPSHQRQGAGAALIRDGLSQLEQLGPQICFVLGSTDYYPRFGFSTGAARGFASPYAGEHFMAIWLQLHMGVQAGRAQHAPAFERMTE
jgi:putative acetyltransferase